VAHFADRHHRELSSEHAYRVATDTHRFDSARRRRVASDFTYSVRTTKRLSREKSAERKQRNKMCTNVWTWTEDGVTILRKLHSRRAQLESGASWWCQLSMYLRTKDGLKECYLLVKCVQRLSHVRNYTAIMKHCNHWCGYRLSRAKKCFSPYFLRLLSQDWSPITMKNVTWLAR
jgi:hypothetical protein